MTGLSHRAVDQIGHILLRVDRRFRDPRQPLALGRDLRPMPEPRPPLIPQQHDIALLEPNLPHRRQHALQMRRLRGHEPRAAVLQLPRELVDRVRRVRRGRGAGGPVQAEVQDGRVDGVGAVEGEDVAARPGVGAGEAAAEGDGEVPDLGVVVGAAGVAVDEEVCEIGALDAVGRVRRGS